MVEKDRAGQLQLIILAYSYHSVVLPHGRAANEERRLVGRADQHAGGPTGGDLGCILYSQHSQYLSPRWFMFTSEKTISSGLNKIFRTVVSPSPPLSGGKSWPGKLFIGKSEANIRNQDKKFE